MRSFLILLIPSLLFLACDATMSGKQNGTSKDSKDLVPDTSNYSIKTLNADLPSPRMEMTGRIDTIDVSVNYGSPSVRGRTIWGGLESYDEVWRMGANEATALHLPFAAEVGGVELEAGSYSIYAVPGAEEWTFTLNANHQRWGVPINDEIRAADVGTFTRSVEATEEMVEQLTVRWEPHGEGMGHLVIQWEKTSVEIPIHGPGM